VSEAWNASPDSTKVYTRVSDREVVSDYRRALGQPWVDRSQRVVVHLPQLQALLVAVPDQPAGDLVRVAERGAGADQPLGQFQRTAVPKLLALLCVAVTNMKPSVTRYDAICPPKATSGKLIT